jgi:selenide,water dikinase
LREILRGGADAVAAAGAVIIGGHSVQDNEPKYGIAVTGVVHPLKIVRNDTARVGDVLVVNKAIGTGIASNLWKSSGESGFSAAAYAEVISSMKQLHHNILPLFGRFEISATTDITGFGFLGHAQSIAAASQVGMTVNASSLPIFPGVLEQAVEWGGGGAKRNIAYIGHAIDRAADVTEDYFTVLNDAQTSGPVLFAVKREQSHAFCDELRSAGYPQAAIIGEITAGPAGRVSVVL